jgi:hypothetical protein
MEGMNILFAAQIRFHNHFQYRLLLPQTFV